MPYLFGIFADCAVRAELAHVGHVHDAHPGPPVFIAVRRIHPLLAFHVGMEIREVEVAIALGQQCIPDGHEEVRLVHVEEPFPEQVHHALDLRILVVVGPRIAAAGCAQRLDLLHGLPEQEEVVRAHLLANLDVRAVERPDGQRAVQGELHVPGAAGLSARRADLLAQIARGDDALRERDAVIRHEHHLHQVAHVGIVVDHAGHVVDQLDDQLGHEVARRRLRGEDERSRHKLQAGILLDPVVLVDDVQDVENLPLVLVQPLDLHIEQRLRIHHDPVVLQNQLGEPTLVLMLDRAEPRLELGIFHHRLKPLQLLEVGDPAVADFFRDQLRKAGIGLEQPPALRDAVRLVVELSGIQLAEVAEQFRPEQFGMQRGHPVDAVAAHDGEMSHADVFLAALPDQRHARDAPGVVGIAGHDLPQETAVDLVDDLDVARKHFLEEAYRPGFQRFRHERVVGVAESADGDIPRHLPLHADLVQQDPHQLGHAEGRMRVVKLDRDLLREAVEVGVVDLEASHDVLDGTRDEEVLLLEPELPALLDVIVRVQDLRDVFGQHLSLVRADIIAVVEKFQVELFRRLGLPEAEVVHGVVAVTRDGNVVGNADDHLAVHPLREEAAVVILVHDPAAETDFELVFGALDFPGVAMAQPVVRFLHLVSVADLLAEDAVIVSHAIAVAGQFHRRQRIEVARGETPQASVPEAGIALQVAQVVPIQPELLHRPRHVGIHAQVDDVAAHRAADQVLHGQVVHPLDVLFVVGLARLDPPLDQPVADGHGQRVVAIEIGGGESVLGERVLEMVLEAQLDGLHSAELVVVPRQVRKGDATVGRLFLAHVHPSFFRATALGSNVLHRHMRKMTASSA
ncbi:MAG: hypothetical protein BWY59_02034 [Verrucomicrobia bacterium ADurb.Bin345]|nr:MAG: hypothetical protein BWY59_02034 [Verrucomicrobia bacterium ADurb.Bin345]